MRKYNVVTPELCEASTRRQRRHMMQLRIAEYGTPIEREALTYARDHYGWEDIVRYTGIPKTQARMLVLGVLA